MISFKGAIKLGFQGYFDFRGKSTPAEFWWWVLFAFLVSAVLTLGGSLYYDFLGLAPNLILALFALVTIIIPGLAVTVRRLHDINKSGWWLLLGFLSWLIIPLIILVVWLMSPSYDEANRQGPGAYVIVGSIIGFIVGIVFAILLPLPSLYLLSQSVYETGISRSLQAAGVLIHLIIYSAFIFAGAKIGRWAYRKTGN